MKLKLFKNEVVSTTKSEEFVNNATALKEKMEVLKMQMVNTLHKIAVLENKQIELQKEADRINNELQLIRENYEC